MNHRVLNGSVMSASRISPQYRKGYIQFKVPSSIGKNYYHNPWTVRDYFCIGNPFLEHSHQQSSYLEITPAHWQLHFAALPEVAAQDEMKG